MTMARRPNMASPTQFAVFKHAQCAQLTTFSANEYQILLLARLGCTERSARLARTAMLPVVYHINSSLTSDVCQSRAKIKCQNNRGVHIGEGEIVCVHIGEGEIVCVHIGEVGQTGRTAV